MPTGIDPLNPLFFNGIGGLIIALILCAIANVSEAAEDDPYLSAISSEAAKVDGTAQPTLEKDDPQAISGQEGPSIEAFEEDLKSRYRGSYTFYEKLPRRTREEVFGEYRDGATIDEIRKKIMDRFLSH
jgi:hypothetical protein